MPCRDSYWILKGLLVSQMNTTAENMCFNLLSLLETYGHIPNGVWYLPRVGTIAMVTSARAVQLVHHLLNTTTQKHWLLVHQSASCCACCRRKDVLPKPQPAAPHVGHDQDCVRRNSEPHAADHCIASTLHACTMHVGAQTVIAASADAVVACFLHVPVHAAEISTICR